MKPFCIGLPGWMPCHATAMPEAHLSIALEVSSEALTRHFSLAEEQTLVRAARVQPVAVYPNRDMIVAVLMLAIETGLRREELFGRP
jgi:hypothetical protein